ncbi:hypothetical protein CYLTODRAFT_389536 [Cylindrobasidium torrendii FP15055 ss-10]|uniref:Glycoside hydrolase family 35 protein n=1 Tax=Cylindrobasidium torrendii FP15055 ss-10 TaxID=1314674 RepID=A0A0D7BN22_9AGAR|nr:hypothetical protein CYLTODRAFT_389536 [Cylindrobasidium torrendii FP15055 ss-10]
MLPVASSLSLSIFAGIFGKVSAHGYVLQIQIGNEYYPGWDVNIDGYASPPPVRPVRATKPDSGFINNVTSGDITCSIGNANLPNLSSTTTIFRSPYAGNYAPRRRRSRVVGLWRRMA